MSFIGRESFPSISLEQNASVNIELPWYLVEQTIHLSHQKMRIYFFQRRIGSVRTLFSCSFTTPTSFTSAFYLHSIITMSRVVVTGIGLVTPLGIGTRATWLNIVKGCSGLISTKLLPDYESAGWDKVPSKVIGKVPNWDPDRCKDKDARRWALFTQYGIVATQEALEDAKLDLDAVDKSKVGVAVGSGIGSFEDAYANSVAFHEKGYKRVQPLFIPRLLNNMAAGNISIKYGLRGPLHSVSTACATGLNAIGDAYNFIHNGYADVMVCGGTEASIHPLALAGFARARSVVTEYEDEPWKALRPFDADRNGFVLSEGCGILILERLEAAKQRNAPIYAEVAGYGLSGDANHITAPLETGDGAYMAMKMALDRAQVDPSQVDYINAHATSTVIGDRAENHAILTLFAKNSNLAVSSTKSSIGHLLGAAGAVEAAFTLKAMETGRLPPTLNLQNVGRHKDDDPAQFERFDYVANESKPKQVNHGLCNSFGFGGVNSSILFSRI